MNAKSISRFSNSIAWIIFGVFPLLFFPVGSLCVNLNEVLLVRSIKEHASIVTKFIPHLQKLRDYAIDVGLFDCILSLSVFSGFLFGIYSIFVLLPRIRVRILEHKVEKIINIKSYIVLLAFCFLSVWFLWVNGPMESVGLPRLMRLVSRSNEGVVTYGVMYYFVSMLTPLFISTLVVITPTLFKCFQKREC
jgi:hypothetical protein